MAKIMGYRGGPITPLTNWDDPPSTGAVILSQLAVGFRTFRGIHQQTPPWKPANDAASFLLFSRTFPWGIHHRHLWEPRRVRKFHARVDDLIYTWIFHIYIYTVYVKFLPFARFFSGEKAQILHTCEIQV